MFHEIADPGAVRGSAGISKPKDSRSATVTSKKDGGGNLASKSKGITIREPDSNKRIRVGSEPEGPNRDKKKKKVIEASSGSGEKENERGPIYIPDWDIREKDQIDGGERAKEMLWNVLPAGEKAFTRGLSAVSLERNFFYKKAQALSLDLELCRRYHKALDTIDQLSAERDSLKVASEETKKENINLKEIMETKDVELATLRSQVEPLLQRLEEEKEARAKWEMEAQRLRDRYETSEGKINKATEHAVLEQFLASQEAKNLFLRLSAPSIRSSYIQAQTAAQVVHPDFMLPEQFQAVIEEINPNVQMPWNEGSSFSVDHLLLPFPTPPSSPDGPEDETVDHLEESEGDEGTGGDPIPPDGASAAETEGQGAANPESSAHESRE